MPSTLPVAHVSLIFENPLWSTEKNFIGSSGTYCTFNVTIATWEYFRPTEFKKLNTILDLNMMMIVIPLQRV